MYCLLMLSIIWGFPNVLYAQNTPDEVRNVELKKWHFAVNAGTHYLQSHYNGYYYLQNPNKTYQDKLDIKFRKSLGLWIGGNINYRFSKNWFFSSEVAFHSIHSGFKVSYLQSTDITYNEERSNYYLLTAKPISVTRIFEINNKWHIPLNLGVHLFFNIYGNRYFRLDYANNPGIVKNEEYERFRFAGGGLAPETGITRKLNKGELSLLVIPTSRIYYFTGETYSQTVRVANSGVILKVQYAFN